ncbi:hypothetical protein BU25DRAFT_452171 [Macroventuria anomochaeta]|uniref:Uncharacterized protein n=1 Tax=Macroventuria anomochaeta TaxID=301207 RepID=A0ACB6RLP8_9PLEO|nr:uncharacterized protein BU25DRAFT_452171 [Macroventuria anomochaeta]KAF2622242.1 hypothetical protein BU25DRAFT_452171 [Macroventuria anomochaeta]
MTTFRLPQSQSPVGHTPLIDLVPANPVSRDASYSNYNENTWRNALGQADRPVADAQPTRWGPSGGLIDHVPSTDQGQPASYSNRNTTGWRQRLETSRAHPLPGPSDPQGPISFNSVGVPTFNPQQWREEQRGRNTSIAPLNAAEVNNSKRDQEDRERMSLPQQFERSFRRTLQYIPSFALLGFGSMNLAIWEQILLLFALALPNGGIGGVLTAFLGTAFGYYLITFSLADMARLYPTYAGPFYWVAALQKSRTTSSLPHQMSWLCAWMSLLGMGINLIVNMIFTSDVAMFLFTLAGKWSKFVYALEEPKNYLRVPWALPVTVGIATIVALIANWKHAKYLPALHRCFVEAFRHFDSTSGWKGAVSGFVSTGVLVQPLLGCGFVAHISEEIVDAAVLIPWTMHVSYLLEVFMAFMILMVIAICIGRNEMLTLRDFAVAMLETTQVPLTYFLSAILLMLFVMRSITLLASISRQLMAIGRSSETKGLNFIDETDRSPAPRNALVVVAILTAGAGALCLLRDYRIVFEHMRRLGALCTLTSHLLCIGTLLFYRIREICATTSTVKLRPSSFKPLKLAVNWFAFGCCLWFFVFVNFPSELPVTWDNAPWSLAVWVCIVIWLLVWYWTSARLDFLVPKTPDNLQDSATDAPAVDTDAPNASAGIQLFRHASPKLSKAVRYLHGDGEVGTSQRESLRRPSTPEWLKRGSGDFDSHRSTGVLNTAEAELHFDDVDANRSQEAVLGKGKQRAQGCLEPSRCPQSLHIPDVGPSTAARPLCGNCETQLSRIAAGNSASAHANAAPRHS